MFSHCVFKFKFMKTKFNYLTNLETTLPQWFVVVVGDWTQNTFKKLTLCNCFTIYYKYTNYTDTN